MSFDGLTQYAPTLTTVDAFKRYKSITSADPSDDGWDDANILRVIRAASEHAAQYTGRVFAPYVDTREYDSGSVFNPAGQRSDTITLDEDLLEVTTLTNADSSALASTAFRAVPLNRLPKTHIRLADGYSWTFTGSITDTVSVSGIWGTVARYPGCWIASTVTVPVGDISDSGSTITFADAATAATFEVLQYLKINDEVLQVIAITDDVVTVTRAELGTTAATHTAGDVIRTFRQLQDVEQAAIQYARWLYNLKDTTMERVQLTDGTSLLINEAPSNIRATYAQYKRSGLEVIR